jgi:N-acetylglutamate synthase-like GNAT family acetyltransferase
MIRDRGTLLRCGGPALRMALPTYPSGPCVRSGKLERTRNMSEHDNGDVRRRVSIRKYAPQDAAEVAKLCGQLGYPTSELQLDERMKQMGQRSSLVVAVDNASNCIAGWIELLVVTHVFSDMCMEIGGLVVNEGVRSRGIGKLLVEAAEEAGRKMRIQRVRVRSNIVRGRAHAFYEQLGYKEVKTSKVFEKTL